MKTIAALALIGVLTLTGCPSVRVSQPVGGQPHVLAKADWEGTWITDRDAARVSVADAAAGKLNVAYLEHSGFPGGGGPNLTTYSVLVRESGGWLFANVADDEGKSEHYEWGRIKLNDDQLLFWEPDVEKFRALVDQGKLTGGLDGKNVNLAPLSATDLAALTSGALGVPFGWDGPVVFHRVAH